MTVDVGTGRHQVRKVLEWGKGAGPFTLKPAKFNFNIPHGLALAEERDEICVADRENGRVQCFDLEGNFKKSVKPAEFGSRIFSVAYTKAKGEWGQCTALPAINTTVSITQADSYTQSPDLSSL